MQSIIKYHNNLNKLDFTGFNTTDYNLFFAICSQLSGDHDLQVTLDFTDLKKIADVDKSNFTDAQFVSHLKAMNRKLLSLNYEAILSQNEIVQFVFFQDFRIRLDDKKMDISINKYAVYLLNDLKKNFTAFELKQFMSLESKYAKTLYRLLKQFRSTGDLMITAEDFRDRLGIPKAYTSKIITRDIIKPTVDALQDFFPHLTYEVVRSSRQGRPIKGYKFIFDADNEIDGQMSVNDYPGVVPESMQPHKRQRRKNANAGMLTHDYDIAALEQTLIHNK